MDLFNRLTQNVIKHQDQGYAFYFKHKDTEIKKLNGVTKEVDSNVINNNAITDDQFFDDFFQDE